MLSKIATYGDDLLYNYLMSLKRSRDCLLYTQIETNRFLLMR